MTSETVEWLGKEPNLLSVDVEMAKVKEILTQMTNEERQEIERVDKSILIRHLRAFKVSLSHFDLFSLFLIKVITGRRGQSHSFHSRVSAMEERLWR